MKKVDVLDLKGEKIKQINLDENIFGIEPNKNVLYDAIILARASLRQGTHKTKNRSEVRGGGRKPWRQKGTGHARQGSIRAVQWVGGGRYGTPVPRDYSKKQNRKERRLALLSALSEKASENNIVVLEELKLKENKTREFVSLLKTLKLDDKKVLVVIDDSELEIAMAARNLGTVLVIGYDELNVLDIVSCDVILTTDETLNKIKEVLS